MNSEQQPASIPGSLLTSLLTSFLAERDAPCPGCGYNLRGNTDGRCPECGATITLGILNGDPLVSMRRLVVIAAVVYVAVRAWVCVDTCRGMFDLATNAAIQWPSVAFQWRVWLTSVFGAIVCGFGSLLVAVCLVRFIRARGSARAAASISLLRVFFVVVTCECVYWLTMYLWRLFV